MAIGESKYKSMARTEIGKDIEQYEEKVSRQKVKMDDIENLEKMQTRIQAQMDFALRIKLISDEYYRQYSAKILRDKAERDREEAHDVSFKRVFINGTDDTLTPYEMVKRNEAAEAQKLEDWQREADKRRQSESNSGNTGTNAKEKNHEAEERT